MRACSCSESMMHYVVNSEGREVEKEEGCCRTLPPTSGNKTQPGRGSTSPLSFTEIGYFTMCDFNGTTSSTVYNGQFSSAIKFTDCTHFNSSGSSKLGSNFPRCSLQSDFLYPYTCNTNLLVTASFKPSNDYRRE